MIEPSTALASEACARLPDCLRLAATLSQSLLVVVVSHPANDSLGFRGSGFRV